MKFLLQAIENTYLVVIEDLPIEYLSDIAIQSSWARSPVGNAHTRPDNLRSLNPAFGSVAHFHLLLIYRAVTLITVAGENHV